ncbi:MULTISPECIES: VOC family protein [Citrobacter]|jgi:catechol 2,3-dioxygenase-like lactoylglutathione lyase family enzyme|uniref:VOC family protein n=1 Tax=Citrobacter braakii TaxID=57706 RepID=A0ABR6TUG2_CITBR|nr:MULTISPECIES: VOC family protein [Citrobacter]KKC63856.1 glyoxalase [Citrobacter amalonaticus]AUU29509.1 glyoxalase/bleomycin resistance/dioxygenase family protein [Citrobacter freundii]EGT0621288.1 glyoxalase/bleomycin resistance/dioxygenase family protein [Citrobacter braakii]EGT0643984.1 glyoxalase/bleomycin resistance/dioxygenase family protein [Citrobacter braakii]EGT0649766.1 glyoxalase/bleomycin resistance/dioxygenase family protein [Citrobacter braakii]
MKFNNVRLLVKDYRKCFNFYTQKLGLEAVWDIEDCYASFKVAEGIEGLAIFTSDLMAPIIGNADREKSIIYREKSMVCFEVDNVDESFEAYSLKGIKFINEPMDMPEWGVRVVHLYDPEENLIELFTPLGG